MAACDVLNPSTYGGCAQNVEDWMGLAAKKAEDSAMSGYQRFMNITASGLQQAAAPVQQAANALAQLEQSTARDVQNTIALTGKTAAQQQAEMRTTIVIVGAVALLALFLLTDMGKATTKVVLKGSASTADLAKVASAAAPLAVLAGV